MAATMRMVAMGPANILTGVVVVIRHLLDVILVQILWRRQRRCRENTRGDASRDFRLELHAGKLARAVPRGRRAGDGPELPGRYILLGSILPSERDQIASFVHECEHCEGFL